MGGGFAIVVDASVARAAGETEHPTSRLCRESLDAMIDGGHLLAMSQPLEEEWKEHASRYAVRWWVLMTSRGKVKTVAQNTSLDQRILKVIDQQARGVVMKDLHLVGTALAADKRIISLERRVHRHLHKAALQIPELQELIWVNPANKEEEVPNWLRDGAPDEQHRHLGYNEL
jgi:hypothetical protein